MQEEDVAQLNLRHSRSGDQAPGADLHECRVQNNETGDVRLVDDVGQAEQPSLDRPLNDQLGGYNRDR